MSEKDIYLLLNNLYKRSAELFSSELLEIEDGKTFKNPWHIQIVYDILDNILTQEILPDHRPGKIVFNRDSTKINRKVCIEIPRNHAKSTAVSVNWVTKELYRNQNARIVIGSNVSTQASSFLREVKSHLERGEILLKKLGSLVPQYPEKWTNSEIIIARTTKKKDPSISTVGTGGAVLSRRADIGILDDILNPDLTRTPEQREKTKFWIDNVWRPVIEPMTGRQIVIGTVWYKGDYLDERMTDTTYDIRLQLRALIKDSKLKVGSDHEYALDIRETFADDVIDVYGISAESGVLWPERWPLDELLAEREGAGSVSFNRQYMNIVLSSEEQIIKTEWLEMAKKRGEHDKFLGSYVVATCPYGPLSVRTQGVDLAISEDTRADWTVEVTLGKTSSGQIKILKIRRGHFSPAETRRMIIEEYKLFDPVIVKVENNAYQESLRKDLADYTDIPIEGYTTGGEKFDEYIGINSIGVLFENGKIDIPYSHEMPEEDKRLIDQLVYECETFSLESHTGDILMALWFAINGLRDMQTVQDPVAVRTSSDIYSGVAGMNEEDD